MYYKQNLLSLKIEIENQKTDDGFGVIQKALSSPHFIILRVRKPGRSYTVYLGRGGDFQGISFQNEIVPSTIRVIDSFLEYIRKHIVGTRIQDIQIDEKDRILYFHLIRSNEKSIFSLFWKGSSLYFIHSEDTKKGHSIFRSWSPGILSQEGKVSITEHEDLFNSLGRGELEHNKDNVVSLDFASYLTFCESLIQNSSILKKAVKKAQRKIKNIELDLSRIRQWPLLEEYINQEDLTDKHQVKLNGIKVDLRGVNGHFKKRNRVYERIKGFKKGEQLLLKRLADAKNDLDKVGNNTEEKSLYEGKVLNPLNERIEQKTGPTPINQKNDFYAYLENKSGLKIYVGRTAQGNDDIRKRIASKNDWWIHLDGYTSSHAFVKSTERPSLETLIVVGSILRDFSKLDIFTIPLLITQVKNLKGVKGIAGKVNFKNEKRITVDYDKLWGNFVEKV